MQRTKRATGLILRRLAFHALLGVLLTYAVMAVAVMWLPVVTYSYGTGIIRIHRTDGDNPLWLRARTWVSPYGTYFQIHRTRPWREQDLQRYFPKAYLEALSPMERKELLENPKAEAPAIPRWSQLHDDWPGSLSQVRNLMEQNGMWYELRMGWPLPCLRGRYATRGGRGPYTWLDNRGVLPVTRTLRWSAGGTSTDTVGMPLIPDGLMFVGSVALYGGITFLSVSAWRIAVHRRRRQPGRCAGCGYDLRGSTDRCPECGERFGAESETGGGRESGSDAWKTCAGRRIR